MAPGGGGRSGLPRPRSMNRSPGWARASAAAWRIPVKNCSGRRPSRSLTAATAIRGCVAQRHNRNRRRSRRRSLAEEDLGRLEEGRVQQLGLVERGLERHELDLRPPQRDHLPVVARGGRVDRRDAEAGPEDTVEGERRAAALHVAEDRHAALEAGALLDLRLELDRDAPEALVAERVRRAAAAVGVAARGDRALGDDDDRESAPARMATADVVAD